MSKKLNKIQFLPIAFVSFTIAYLLCFCRPDYNYYVKFSLILCTYQRKFEVVDAFVESLLNNTYKNWELIVVDQNENNEILSGIEQKYKDFLRTGKIRVFKVPFKGLSRSRNFGLQYISLDADVIAFPDDDCEYPPELLEKISKLLENPKIDIVTGRSIDKKTKQDSNGRWSSKDTRINLYNVWITATSFTIFVRRKCLKNTGVSFDEKLGVGSNSPFGAAEDIDIMMSLLKNKCKGYYFRDITVYHPVKEVPFEKHASYSRGTGAAFKRNFTWRLDFLAGFLDLMFIRPLGGLIYSALRLDFKKIKLYATVLCGRWAGFFKY